MGGAPTLPPPGTRHRIHYLPRDPGVISREPPGRQAIFGSVLSWGLNGAIPALAEGFFRKFVQTNPVGIAGDLALIVVAALVGGLLAQWLRLPLVLGYIVAGIAVGPNTAGPTVTQVHDMEVLADVGVALLLFTVGLEFSPQRLKPIGLVTFVGTPVQIALTCLFGWAVAAALHLPPNSGLWFACLIPLSSTMISIKLLIDNGYSKALSGRLMLAMLVVQDLAAIPLMVVLPGLSQDGQMGPSGLLLSLVKAVAVIAVMLPFGARVLPALLERVLRSGSREMFLVAVVGVALGVSYLSHLCGLSFALGAFVAGLVLSQSECSDHALGTVGPFRDLFGMIFFVSIGILVEPGYLWDNLGLVLAVTAVVMAGKGLIFAGVVWCFGYRKVIPFAVAFGLSQVGEFSFVLARSGLQGGSLDRATHDLILMLAVLSMAVTPFAFSLSKPVYLLWRRWRPQSSLPSHDPEPLEARIGHLVLAGYGKVGRHVAELLKQAEQPFVLCELDWNRFEEARRAGIEAVFGDFTSSSVIEALHLDKARLMILTTREAGTTRRAIDEVRRFHPNITFLALAYSQDQIERLHQLGVSESIWPEREAAVQLVQRALANAEGCEVN